MLLRHDTQLNLGLNSVPRRTKWSMREVESFFGQNKIFELKLRIPLHGNWNRFYLSVSIVNMSNII